MRDKDEMTDKKRKGIAVICIAAVVLLMAAVAYYVGKPMIRFVSEPERFRAWVDCHGIWGRLAFLGMTMLQVIVAVIPGEPMELVAGYAFGSAEGTALCIIGATLGGVPVVLLVRRFGMKAVEIFFPREKIDSLKFLKSSRKRDLWVFILFLIPGTPKDLLNYFVGLTDMKMSRWLLISLVARIPSIVTSTIGGDALGMKNYTFAAVVFAVTLAVSGAGLWAYRQICRRHEAKKSSVDN